MNLIRTPDRRALLVSLVIAMALILAACTQSNVLKTGEPPQPQPEPTPEASPVESNTALAAEWSDPPPCRTIPLTAEALGRLQDNPLELQRAAALTHMTNPQALLTSSAEQSILTSLALTVASGHMNSATGLDLPGLPDVKTVGALLARLEEGLATNNTSAELVLAAQQVQAGQGIVYPVCARLFVTQADRQPEQLEWSGAGVQPARSTVRIAQAPATGLVMDGGQAAPDGKQVAFNSLGYETGGPVFILDLASGEWTNLIEKLNAQIAEGQPHLQETLWWEVIGWFPDSQRIMIGPAELSSVYMVDLDNFSSQVYPFPGGGIGGSGFVQLAPDGSHFVFVTNLEDGSQALNTFDLASKQISTLVRLTDGQQLLRYPRFAPDGSSLAYLVERGHPTTGLTYAIDLISLETHSTQTLVEGNLGLTVPAWSPDGQQIAFTRKETDEPDLVIPEQVPPPMRGNIWIVSATGGPPQQITQIDGWARSPAWDFDSQTLAFVNQDGQVGMVDISRPGSMWMVAETTAGAPLITSAFFVP